MVSENYLSTTPLSHDCASREVPTSVKMTLRSEALAQQTKRQWQSRHYKSNLSSNNLANYSLLSNTQCGYKNCQHVFEHRSMTGVGRLGLVSPWLHRFRFYRTSWQQPHTVLPHYGSTILCDSYGSTKPQHRCRLLPLLLLLVCRT